MKNFGNYLSWRVILPVGVLAGMALVPISPVDAANFRDIPVKLTFDSMHMNVSAAPEQARMPSGFGQNQIVGDPSNDYLDGGKVDTNVGRNRNIWLYGNASNKTASGRTIWLDLSVAFGCQGSVNVDVDDLAGCDLCSDTAPALPNLRFGPLQPPDHPDEFKGLPDNFELSISGEDHDDLLEDATVSVGARLRFWIGSDGWTLHWGPFRQPGGWTANPESDPILVRRVSINGKDTWQIQTSGQHRAALYRSSNSPGGAPEYHGQFEMAFSGVAEAIVNRAIDVPHTDPLLSPGDLECFPMPCTDADNDGSTTCDGDCDDSDSSVNPDAAEVCGDGVDNNCDGVIDEGCGDPCSDVDADGDGWTECDGDCDDTNPRVNPGRNEKGPRASDGLDNDCNGTIDG